jgi:3-dehydroquinate dehydratase-2
MNGLIINPAALTHYSWALRDAVAILDVPVYEVHLSNIHRREAFRRISVLKDVRTAQLHGKGIESYFEALRRLSYGNNKRPGAPEAPF